ncbi:MAG: YigZ family protein [Eubacteriales bacterium]
MFAPTQWGEAELVEKKSRFLGQVWRVESEDEARAHIQATKKRYHDARHHCFCYRIDSTIMRYSDDGEPQGTAGQPMLHLFEQEEIVRVCCVVTRYFGGTLLGTGGLVRAYGHTAKLALEQAGRSQRKLLSQLEITCSYPHFESVQKTILAHGGIMDTTDYGVEIVLQIRLEHQVELFLADLSEVTAGSAKATPLGEIEDWVALSLF